MEPFSALLALCEGNSLVTVEFPTQRPVTRSFGVFLELRLNKRLSKQPWGWWFESLSRPLWRHRNDNLQCSRRCPYNIMSIFPCFERPHDSAAFCAGFVHCKIWYDVIWYDMTLHGMTWYLIYVIFDIVNCLFINLCVYDVWIGASPWGLVMGLTTETASLHWN